MLPAELYKIRDWIIEKNQSSNDVIIFGLCRIKHPGILPILRKNIDKIQKYNLITFAHLKRPL